MTGALVGFFLTFIRISAMLTTLPAFGAKGVPRHVPILGGLAIATILAPTLPTPPGPMGLGTLAVGVVGEVALGVLAGLCVYVTFAAMSAAADLVAQQVGLGMGATLDPFLEHSESPIGILTSWMAALVFFGTGLHHKCLLALADSLHAVPPGTIAALDLGHLPRALSAAYALSVSLASPVVALTVTINTFMAVLGRLAPRMNAFFAIGTTVTAVAGLLLYVEALPWITSVHQAAVEAAVRDLPRLWGR